MIVIGGLSVLALAALGLAEALVRLLGLTRFPLYVADPACNYRMAPDQAGTFRRLTAWRYGAHGIRRDSTPESFAGAVLLVGDSIVDCSPHIDQQETLAACLERVLSRPVYPLAAPGWSLGNGLGALAALPGWDQASQIVLVLNYGDFDYDAEASSEFGFPMRRPWLASIWLVRRNLFLRGVSRRAAIEGTAQVPRNPALRQRNLARLAAMARESGAGFLIVRHPGRDEGPASDGYFAELAAAAQCPLIDAAEAPGWSGGCYRDHIHLSVAGARVLAAHLAQQLVKT